MESPSLNKKPKRKYLRHTSLQSVCVVALQCSDHEAYQIISHLSNCKTLPCSLVLCLKGKKGKKMKIRGIF
jgi:hypothetical protein